MIVVLKWILHRCVTRMRENSVSRKLTLALLECNCFTRFAWWFRRVFNEMVISQNKKKNNKKQHLMCNTCKVPWYHTELQIRHFFHENICCGYSLEVPRRGTSNEYTQNMFWGEIRKILIWVFLSRAMPYTNSESLAQPANLQSDQSLLCWKMHIYAPVSIDSISRHWRSNQTVQVCRQNWAHIACILNKGIFHVLPIICSGISLDFNLTKWSWCDCRT